MNKLVEYNNYKIIIIIIIIIISTQVMRPHAQHVPLTQN